MPADLVALQLRKNKMLTVQNLIEINELKIGVLAGGAGTGRVITWAHTVDLPDPWRWASPGDLVMTTGVGLPRTEEGQVEWLERLIQSNVSALVVAPPDDSLVLSQGMLNAADRLLFPVLCASFELEFVKLSHLVIESVLHAQRARFNAVERLFQTYADALRKEPEMVGRLSALADALDLDLAIEDVVSGLPIITTSRRFPDNGERIPIPGRARANLVVARKLGPTGDDVMLVRSLVGLLGVELERSMIHRDAQREEGEQLLVSLLESETAFAMARPTLERKGLNGALVSLAVRAAAEGAWQVDQIHHSPAFHQNVPLFLVQNGLLLVLCRDDGAVIDALCSSLGVGTIVGVSATIASGTGFRESARQAKLALYQAEEAGLQVLRYGEMDKGLVMAPKSMSEARALVARYLGPLIEHDRTQGAALLNTLIRFLENNGNWKATAMDLGIHRQTLVYRLKLVEQLTGLRPTTTQGIARFWIAIQAGTNCELLSPLP